MRTNCRTLPRKVSIGDMSSGDPTSKLVVATIGHSTHPIGEFIEILQSHDVKQVADVRTIPRSRYNPQFNSGELKDALEQSGITYFHLAALGGLRHVTKDSTNT